MSITKIKNNYGIKNGINMLTKFYDNCSTNSNKVDPRKYHFGIKSILDDDKADTVYADGTLILAEGISPRWMLLR